MKGCDDPRQVRQARLARALRANLRRRKAADPVPDPGRGVAPPSKSPTDEDEERD